MKRKEEMAKPNAVCLHSHSLTTGVRTSSVYLVYTRGVESNLCRIAVLTCPHVLARVPIIEFDTIPILEIDTILIIEIDRYDTR